MPGGDMRRWRRMEAFPFRSHGLSRAPCPPATSSRSALNSGYSCYARPSGATTPSAKSHSPLFVGPLAFATPTIVPAAAQRRGEPKRAAAVDGGGGPDRVHVARRESKAGSLATLPIAHVQHRFAFFVHVRATSPVRPSRSASLAALLAIATPTVRRRRKKTKPLAATYGVR